MNRVILLRGKLKYVQGVCMCMCVFLGIYACGHMCGSVHNYEDITCM